MRTIPTVFALSLTFALSGLSSPIFSASADEKKAGQDTEHCDKCHEKGKKECKKCHDGKECKDCGKECKSCADGKKCEHCARHEHGAKAETPSAEKSPVVAPVKK